MKPQACCVVTLTFAGDENASAYAGWFGCVNGFCILTTSPELIRGTFCGCRLLRLVFKAHVRVCAGVVTLGGGRVGGSGSYEAKGWASWRPRWSPSVERLCPGAGLRGPRELRPCAARAPTAPRRPCLALRLRGAAGGSPSGGLDSHPSSSRPGSAFSLVSLPFVRSRPRSAPHAAGRPLIGAGRPCRRPMPLSVRHPPRVPTSAWSSSSSPRQL